MGERPMFCPRCDTGCTVLTAGPWRCPHCHQPMRHGTLVQRVGQQSLDLGVVS